MADAGTAGSPADGCLEESRGARLMESETDAALAAPGRADLEGDCGEAFVGFGGSQADPDGMVLGWGLLHDDEGSAPADVRQPGGRGEELVFGLPPSEPDDISPRGVARGAPALVRRLGEPAPELVEETGSLRAPAINRVIHRGWIAADDSPPATGAGLRAGPSYMHNTSARQDVLTGQGLATSLWSGLSPFRAMQTRATGPKASLGSCHRPVNECRRKEAHAL